MANKKNRTYTKGNKEYERRRQKVGKVLVGVKGDYKLDNIKNYVNSHTKLDDASSYLEVNENGLLVVDPSAPSSYSATLDEIVGEINSWKRDSALKVHHDGRKNQLRERSLDAHMLEMESKEQANRMKMLFNAGYDNMKEVADALGVSELDVADNTRWESTSAGTRFLMKNANGEVVGAKEFVFGYGGQAWFQENVVGRDESGVYLLQVDKKDIDEYDTATNLFKQKDPKRHRVWFKSKER